MAFTARVSSELARLHTSSALGEPLQTHGRAAPRRRAAKRGARWGHRGHKGHNRRAAVADTYARRALMVQSISRASAPAGAQTRSLEVVAQPEPLALSQALARPSPRRTAALACSAHLRTQHCWRGSRWSRWAAGACRLGCRLALIFAVLANLAGSLVEPPRLASPCLGSHCSTRAQAASRTRSIDPRALRDSPALRLGRREASFTAGENSKLKTQN